ncbi:MAG TPA: asparagine synthase (glutamine-hydrolyzing) [Methylomirabilota bacterium]|jgi:asparagine synthase (glutamine-hydrolysing)
MCGVCGIAAPGVGLDGVRASDHVRAMVEALAHRGPDDSGVHATGAAVLGATRLAIRGLADGRQPMVDAGSGIVVVCNGEIDNHASLRSWLAARGRPVLAATDVAVIPALYLELGDGFVERLAGVFAVAIWDPRRDRLLLARDRAGERPLFYCLADGMVRFATEISALRMDPALRLTPDREALARYVRFGYFTAPETPFSEVRKVAPGEAVVIEQGRVTRRRYWRWAITTDPKRAPAPQAFDEVFREAVRRQSDAEVECGVFLSGGLDSSLVAAVAKDLAPGRKLRAYTLRFGEASYDEGAFAEQVARHLGLDWTPVSVTPDALREGIPELIRVVGEPLADPAWVPTALLARRASRDVKLALVGEGADELFGGYPTYVGATLAERYMRLPGAARALLRALVERWPPSDRKVTVSYLLKRFVAAAELGPVGRHRHWTSSTSPEHLGKLGLADAAPDTPDSDGNVLDVLQRMDLETSLAEGLLTKADRASMNSALELRAPYLDQSVMEFAASLPVEQRVRGAATKVFLKRYALRYLPSRIVYRRKRGLSVPLARWLREPLHDWAASRLGDHRLRTVGMDPEAALALLEAHRRRQGDHARALWTLVVLAEWVAWASDREGTAAGNA